MNNENVAKQLIVKSLQFVKAVKKIEKFWEIALESVCMRCHGISHKCLGNYRNRSEKCSICAEKD